MRSKVMLTMESRIHGDMYVRFGGGLTETYHCKVAKRCWPSLLKEMADTSDITNPFPFYCPVYIHQYVNIDQWGTYRKLLGHSKLTTTRIYAKVVGRKLTDDMDILKR